MTKAAAPRDKSVFREYFELIAETAVFVFFVMTFVVQAFQIPTGSMEPTLLKRPEGQAEESGQLPSQGALAADAPDHQLSRANRQPEITKRRGGSAGFSPAVYVFSIRAKIYRNTLGL